MQEKGKTKARAAKREEFIARFGRFISGLGQADKIAVLYHSDADGLCAAACAIRALKKLGLKPKLVLCCKMPGAVFGNENLEQLKGRGINKIIALDLCADQNASGAEKAEGFAELLVIDHHKLYNDLNSERTIMIKSQFLSSAEPSTYPASKLAFDLFGQVADMGGTDWIAAVGIIADASAKRWPEFIRRTAAKYKVAVKDLEKIDRVIGGVEVLCQARLDELLGEFVGAPGPSAILRSKFASNLPELDRVMEDAMSTALKNAEHHEKIGLVMCGIKSRHELKSALINRLSMEQFPDKTVVVILDSGGPLIRFSARRQDGKVKVNDLLEAAVKGLEKASAGGHAPAAAGRVLRPDLPKFKKNLIAELGKVYGN